jgi:hypothetical protein
MKYFDPPLSWKEWEDYVWNLGLKDAEKARRATKEPPRKTKNKPPEQIQEVLLDLGGPDAFD